MTGWGFLVCKGFLLNLSIAKQKIELLEGRKVPVEQAAISASLSFVGDLSKLRLGSTRNCEVCCPRWPLDLPMESDDTIHL
jgi:hypothetical protein